MKFHKFLMLRILTGLIGFVAIIFVVSIIFNIHYEITIMPKFIGTEKAIMSTYILNGDLEGKTKEEEAQFREQVHNQLLHSFGLDKPRIVRIVESTRKAITLDLGTTKFRSAKSRQSLTVRAAILEALPNTLILFVMSTTISVLLAIYIGVKKAQYLNSTFDKITSFLTMFFLGMPSWITGSFLVLIFVYYLKILPFGALYSTNPIPVGALEMAIDRAKHMSIPIMSIVLVRIWGNSYQIRNILLSQLQEDYITAARGRGFSEDRVVFGHALRTASPAVFTMSFLTILNSFGGDIVLEKVLAWPGLGLLLWNAINANDINLMLGIVTVITFIFVVALVFVDAFYAILDPRITYNYF